MKKELKKAVLVDIDGTEALLMIRQFINAIPQEKLPDWVADPEVWFGVTSSSQDEVMRGIMVAFVCHIHILSEEQLRMIPELLKIYGAPTFYKWEDPVAQASYDAEIELARRAIESAIESARRAGRPIVGR